MTGEEGLRVYTDGASRGNPGRAACAYVIVQGGRVLCERSIYLGVTTNNVAEYRAVIAALTAAQEYTDGPVTLYSDSELVVRQLTGRYRVNKEHLKDLHAEALRCTARFSSVVFEAVRRTDPWIRRADELCNLELDRGRSG